MLESTKVPFAHHETNADSGSVTSFNEKSRTSVGIQMIVKLILKKTKGPDKIRSGYPFPLLEP